MSSKLIKRTCKIVFTSRVQVKIPLNIPRRQGLDDHLPLTDAVYLHFRHLRPFLLFGRRIYDAIDGETCARMPVGGFLLDGCVSDKNSGWRATEIMHNIFKTSRADAARARGAVKMRLIYVFVNVIY